MTEHITGTGRTTRIVTVGALALGLAAGGFGVASAASGSSTTAAASTTAAPAAAPTAGTTPPSTPWGGQRSDETVLTGDTASKVQAAAEAKLGSGATVVRIETDADGHAAYEVHATKADGTPITVYVDTTFAVIGVETR